MKSTRSYRSIAPRAAFLVAVLVLFGLWILWPSMLNVSTVTIPQSHPPASFAVKSGKPVVPSAMVTQEAAAVEPRDAAISGLAFWKDTGAPIEGIEIHLRPWRLGSGPYLELVESPTWVTSTDALGHFRFDPIPAGDYVLQRQYWNGAALPQNAESIHIQISPGEHTAGITLAVPSGFSAKGRVLDAYGRPVAMAKVNTSERLCATDALGWYSVEGLRNGENRVLSASARGYARKSRLVRILEGEAPDLDFQLDEPGFGISGRVVSDCGVPLGGIRVAVDSDGLIARADGDGCFEIAGISAQASPLSLGVYVGNHKVSLVSGDIPYRVGPASTLNDLVLIAPIRVQDASVSTMKAGKCSGILAEGRVLSLEGMPIAGAEVTGQSADGVFGVAVTAADGSYALPLGPDPRIKVMAVASRYESSGIIETESSALDFVVYLKAAGQVHCRVLAAETGEPIQQFQIIPIPQHSPRHIQSSQQMEASATTIFDADGRCSWTVDSKGSGLLCIRAEGFAPVTLQATPGKSEVIVALRPECVLTGSVADEMGRPARNILVVVHCDTNAATHGLVPDLSGQPFFQVAETLSGADGRFAIHGLDALVYDVEVGGGPYGHETKRVDLSGTNHLELRINLMTLSAIRGIAVSDNQPVPSVLILARNLDPSSDGALSERKTITNNSGEFLMRSLLPGMYEVTCMTEYIEHSPRINFESKVVVLEPGYEYYVELEGDVTAN